MAFGNKGRFVWYHILMDELWQLYDEQGRVLPGKGATKNEAFLKGLLHGAAHVWIWRSGDAGVEILLQKRSSTKRTWANRYDISAAGHINLGEHPIQAALRETIEEIGLEIEETSLKLISVQRTYMVAESNAIENEFQWLYLLQMSEATTFDLQAEEVALLEWKLIADLKADVKKISDLYVPHGDLYYDTVIAAVQSEAKQ